MPSTTPNAVRTPTTEQRMTATIVEALLQRGRVEKADLTQAGFSQAEILAHVEPAMLTARKDRRVTNILAEMA